MRDVTPRTYRLSPAANGNRGRTRRRAAWRVLIGLSIALGIPAGAVSAYAYKAWQADRSMPRVIHLWKGSTR